MTTWEQKIAVALEHIIISSVCDVMLGVCTTKEDLEGLLFDLTHQDAAANKDNVPVDEELAAQIKKYLWENLVPFGINNYGLFTAIEAENINYEDFIVRETLADKIRLILKEKVEDKLQRQADYNPPPCDDKRTGNEAGFKNIDEMITNLTGILKVIALLLFPSKAVQLYCRHEESFSKRI